LLAEGVTDELLAEVGRVIFQAHPNEDRMERPNFASWSISAPRADAPCA
jgi:hypothetical protein